MIGTPLLPSPMHASVNSNGYLQWPPPPRCGAPFKRPPANLCFQFAKLADGSNDHIRRFAANWGCLGHELGIQQHVDEWRRYARLAQAILRLAGQQHSGGRGNPEDWITLWAWIEPRMGCVEMKRMHKRERMAVLASAVNTWFSQAQGNGILTLRGDALQVLPQGANLFGILNTQIAYVIARSDQMVVCAGCHDPFPPRRPLSRGSRQYCRACRARKVPQRDAARDYRRRFRLRTSDE
jgi:hypothetical protein